ncbi:eCIS core domain-containing protein [Massilia aurea]|uniref:eCIS core domain-containing protein n=1 Tax=Massilia aurea TaxID=373040 RepID=UPI000F2DD69C|nr:DUF4157 domain-containing protein [Massilia aurea]
MQVPQQTRDDTDAHRLDVASTTKGEGSFVDSRPAAAAQRELAKMSNNSPRVLQQRAPGDAIHGGPRMVAQRHETNALFGSAGRGQGEGLASAGMSPAPHEESINNTGLPNRLKSGIESLSGMRVDHIRVHYNSEKPAQLQAHAYAQGGEIHLGAGQERHLPHEAWHVVQQAQGRVAPTLQTKTGALNDAPSLEKEADTMGEKAARFEVHPDAGSLVAAQRVAGVSAQDSTGFRQPPSPVVQRKPLPKKVTGLTHLVALREGGLFREENDNEGAEVSHGDQVIIDTNVRRRSRRGPNQEDHSEEDRTGPAHYLWYAVLSVNGVEQPEGLFIREDTLTHPGHDAALARPLQSTVYGTDGSTPEEIRDAYGEGYRDFDCAYGYHGGATYRLFRTFPIISPVRIIYKFKLEKLDGAAAELARLARTPGVIIHTVMLHEVPGSPADLDRALEELAVLSQTYQCRAGVSNVAVAEGVAGFDLDTMRSKMRDAGSDISVVENRMSPATPDRIVRDYCKRHGIQYLAYSLTGSTKEASGTCGMVPGAGTGEYRLLNDPMLKELAVKMDILPDDLRYVIYTWARQQGAQVIARSSQQDRRAANRRDITHHLLPVANAELDDFARDHPSGLLRPFHAYLLSKGVEESHVNELVSKIEAPWLNIYYRNEVVDRNEDLLTPALMDATLRDKLMKQARARWDDLTQLRKFLSELSVLPELNQLRLDERPTGQELVRLLKGASGVLFNDVSIDAGAIEAAVRGATNDDCFMLVNNGATFSYTMTETGWELAK